MSFTQWAGASQLGAAAAPPQMYLYQPAAAAMGPQGTSVPMTALPGSLQMAAMAAAGIPGGMAGGMQTPVGHIPAIMPAALQAGALQAANLAASGGSGGGVGGGSFGQTLSGAQGSASTGLALPVSKQKPPAAQKGFAGTPSGSLGGNPGATEPPSATKPRSGGGAPAAAVGGPSSSAKAAESGQKMQKMGEAEARPPCPTAIYVDLTCLREREP